MAIRCPFCGSTDLHITDTGYSLKKGALGYFAFGIVGTLLGNHGSKRPMCYCLSCGKKFDARNAEQVSDIGNRMQKAQEELREIQARKEKADAEIQRQMDEIKAKSQIRMESYQYESAKLHKPNAPKVKPQFVRCDCGAYNNLYDKVCFNCGATVDLKGREIFRDRVNRVVICECGSRNQPTFKFCIGCGKKMDYKNAEEKEAQMQFSEEPCPHCGQDRPIGSRKVHFCPHCGGNIDVPKV